MILTSKNIFNYLMTVVKRRKTKPIEQNKTKIFLQTTILYPTEWKNICYPQSYNELICDYDLTMRISIKMQKYKTSIKNDGS